MHHISNVLRLYNNTFVTSSHSHVFHLWSCSSSLHFPKLFNRVQIFFYFRPEMHLGCGAKFEDLANSNRFTVLFNIPGGTICFVFLKKSLFLLLLLFVVVVCCCCLLLLFFVVVFMVVLELGGLICSTKLINPNLSTRY